MCACYWREEAEGIDEFELLSDLKVETVKISCFDKTRPRNSVSWEGNRSGSASAAWAIIYPTNWCHGILNHCGPSALQASSEMFTELYKFRQTHKCSFVEVIELTGSFVCCSVAHCIHGYLAGYFSWK